MRIILPNAGETKLGVRVNEAVFALAGALIGGLASFGGTWLTVSASARKEYRLHLRDSVVSDYQAMLAHLDELRLEAYSDSVMFEAASVTGESFGNELPEWWSRLHLAAPGRVWRRYEQAVTAVHGVGMARENLPPEAPGYLHDQDPEYGQAMRQYRRARRRLTSAMRSHLRL